jgi:hypothetical protein
MAAVSVPTENRPPPKPISADADRGTAAKGEPSGAAKITQPRTRRCRPAAPSAASAIGVEAARSRRRAASAKRDQRAAREDGGEQVVATDAEARISPP